MDRDNPAVSAYTIGLRLGWYGLLAVPLLFLLVFYFYPLASILWVSLAPDGQPDLSSFGRLILSPYYRETLWFTLWQAVLSTALTIGLALPGAYVFTRYRFPGKRLLMALTALPFVLPTVVVAAAFSALVGSNGIINNALERLFSLETVPIQLERTLALILIVHVFYNYTLALRMITGYWANQNTRIEEAARVLGSHGWRLWWEIRLPALRPVLLAAALLVFIFTFTSFGVILILGGVRFATLEVEIYRQTVNYVNGLPMAAALSLVQIVIMGAALIVYTRLQRRVVVDLQSAESVARQPRTRGEKAFVTATLVVIVVMLFTPLLALVIRSFTGTEGFTTEYYTALGQNSRNSVLFVPPSTAIRNSLLFALVTTALSVFLGFIAAYLLTRRARWLDPIFMLPLATSAVTLGFGLFIALDSPPLNLRRSPLLVVIAHTLVALPFVVRSVVPALRSVPAPLREAAATLGAPPWKVWLWVDLPLISRGLVVGATFAFTVSMGEFGASTFVARPDTPTIPIVIFRLLGQPGAVNYGQGIALSVLLMAVCAVSFVLIERIRTAGVGEF
ncbi:MAG: iron ABC transporter permease [bacterium]|nr:iron ABC transporter permease [bacterium]